MKKQKPITKAVIAAAGYGTRFLPATKNQPKEMLTIINKPIINYLVEEAVASGIKTIILVTRAGKSVLEDYFDVNLELENILKKTGKTKALKVIQQISRLANFVYVRQKPCPYGGAAPLLTIKNLIDEDEAFVYIFGDDLIKSKIPATQQLIRFYNKYKPSAVLAAQEVPGQEVKNYGAIQLKKGTTNYQVKKIWEKVPAKQAPSNLVQVGRFILTYKVIEEAAKTPLGKQKELSIADVFNRLIPKTTILAYPFNGRWLTTGDPLNYLKATVELALEKPNIGLKFKKYLKDLSL